MYIHIDRHARDNTSCVRSERIHISLYDDIGTNENHMHYIFVPDQGGLEGPQERWFNIHGWGTETKLNASIVDGWG